MRDLARAFTTLLTSIAASSSPRREPVASQAVGHRHALPPRIQQLHLVPALPHELRDRRHRHVRVALRAVARQREAILGPRAPRRLHSELLQDVRGHLTRLQHPRRGHPRVLYARQRRLNVRVRVDEKRRLGGLRHRVPTARAVDDPLRHQRFLVVAAAQTLDGHAHPRSAAVVFAQQDGRRVRRRERARVVARIQLGRVVVVARVRGGVPVEGGAGIVFVLGARRASSRPVAEQRVNRLHADVYLRLRDRAGDAHLLRVRLRGERAARRQRDREAARSRVHGEPRRDRDDRVDRGEHVFEDASGRERSNERALGDVPQRDLAVRVLREDAHAVVQLRVLHDRRGAADRDGRKRVRRRRACGRRA
eukprot:23689-Pelagococcus_subviridis.AAC.2